MNLTTAERVRKLLMGGGIDAGTALGTDASDALAQLIAEVSATAERFLDRQAQSGSTVEYHDVEPGKLVYRLRAYPVTAVASVYLDPDQSFGAATALTSTDYYSPIVDPAGVFQLRLCPSFAAPASLKITYTGGMAADADAFVLAFPALAMAIEQQVIWQWKTRNTMGILNLSDGLGTVALPQVDFLPSVKQVLSMYRRWNAA